MGLCGADQNRLWTSSHRAEQRRHSADYALFSKTHDATQRWRQSAVVGGHDHSLYPPTAADDIYLHHRSAPCVSSIPLTVSIQDFFSRRVGKLPPTPHHCCRRRDTGKHCITDRPRLRKPREGYGWTISVKTGR